MSNAKKQKVKKQKKLWKLMEPILSKHPNGIEAKQLSHQINANTNTNNKTVIYSDEFIVEFLNHMKSKVRLIAFVTNNPLTIRRRNPSNANKLYKLSLEQYNIYQQIEASQNDGILMRRLTQNNPKLCKKQITKIITQILETQNLTSRFKSKMNNQTYYHAICYSPRPEKQETEFDKDKDFMEVIYMIILTQIKASNINGISCNELFEIIETSGLLNDKNDLSIQQIETIIQLLLFENKIYFIPNSIPINNLNKFLTKSKNTYYHLIKAIRNIKRKLDYDLSDERWNKKRKLNDSKSMKITVEYDDFENVNVNNKDINVEHDEEKMNIEERFNNINVKQYSDIKFRYNNWNSDESTFSEIPCQSCPVVDNCFDDGLINPNHCPYLNAWLEI
eukprot:112743_1